MNIEAKWIWSNRDRLTAYNQAAIFVREFELESYDRASIAITADSWYRLTINGQWVNDGPCRNYPNHYQYEQIDLAGVLRRGRNRIEILGRYFGSGTAHQLPQQAGILAQLEVLTASGEYIRIGTDASWLTADFSALIPNTARFSIKQDPAELYDARRVPETFNAAEEICDAEGGPWTGLHPRDCRLLTRNEAPMRRFVGAGMITSTIWNLSIPAQKLLHPGNATTNFSTSLSCGVVFRVVSDTNREYDVFSENTAIFINGQRINPEPDLLHLCRGRFQQGENVLVVVPKYPFENQTDLCATIVNPVGLTFNNPISTEPQKICFLKFPHLHWLNSEIPRHMWANEELLCRQTTATEFLSGIGAGIRTTSDLKEITGKYIEHLDPTAFSDDYAHWEFCARQVAPLPKNAVVHPENLMFENQEWTEIHPVAGGDVELIYDLGEQNCGYWDFELEAAEGTMVDLFGVEYIDAEGKVQHTDDVRNGFRYVCREGLNRYTSVRRRSGRYLFLTIRKATRLVRIRYVRLFSATYPVDQQGAFHSSDETLNRIWAISARTVKLCMEDVFTDCPCYEQSLWLGDARNIALFSFPVFAPWDLARRCIRLGGYSLDRYPIAGSQVPSGWDCLIPCWSFLWGVSVWDYFEETADVAFLKEVFPMVRKNIDGAWAHIDPDNGLFSMYSWNLFEWVETDTHQPRMLYDSMVLSAALQAAEKCARVLELRDEEAELNRRRRALNRAVNKTWLPERNAYPDSLRKEGDVVVVDLPANLAPGGVAGKYEGPCRDISVHTSMLAVLFDIVDEEYFEAAAENVLHPRPELFKVRNLFARFYLYQAMERLGREDRILDQLRQDYREMLETDSTTTWENFFNHRGFPCRSHSHAWSACALYFFNRLILGLRMMTPGAKEFVFSPLVDGLDFVDGSRATIRGPIRVRWKKCGNVLTIRTEVPSGVILNFASNPSLADLKVWWNGIDMDTSKGSSERRYQQIPLDRSQAEISPEEENLSYSAS